MSSFEVSRIPLRLLLEPPCPEDCFPGPQRIGLYASDVLYRWVAGTKGDPSLDGGTSRRLAKQCGIREEDVAQWFKAAMARRARGWKKTLVKGGWYKEKHHNMDWLEVGFASLMHKDSNSQISRVDSLVPGSSHSAQGALESGTSSKTTGRGKGKVHDNGISPDPGISLTVAPTSTTSDCSSEGRGQVMWPCTFCVQSVEPERWRSHEAKHRPRPTWICLRYGARLALHPDARNDSSSKAPEHTVCAFCMEPNPSDEHLLHKHRIVECMARPLSARTYGKRNMLVQHCKWVHGTKALSDLALSTWENEEKADEIKSWVCGFCKGKFTWWPHRQAHVAKHLKAGLRRVDWKYGTVPFEDAYQDTERRRTADRITKENTLAYWDQVVQPTLGSVPLPFTALSIADRYIPGINEP
ncbi:hypothetical protein T440DRAFT_254748 [Plenodomus tracheiphilus IPT5]|uniref:C2H2-type domain-containing protein n=1 Tax=Plenodomus tracheiphilus IPT5 TaxID=1408161 RepID=A0A6A7AUG6_9PLEO|nr:hypothetical protein T440DRAFT_254748 [Plenodomus tracheiphilus IPT5]